MFPRPEQISLHVYGLIKFLAEYSFLHTRFSKLTESEVQGGLSTISAVLTFIHIFLFHPVQFNSKPDRLQLSNSAPSEETDQPSQMWWKIWAANPKVSGRGFMASNIQVMGHPKVKILFCNLLIFVSFQPYITFLYSVEHKRRHSVEFTSCFFSINESKWWPQLGLFTFTVWEKSKSKKALDQHEGE